jgi:hypothetical protein
MLEKALAETDPETTDVVVMTAKLMQRGNPLVGAHDFDYYDRQLMTAVVDRAEKIGKHVIPLIVPTNNPLFAIVKTGYNVQAHELILGASNKYTADEQLEQVAFYWINLNEGLIEPLTVRILSRHSDVYLDLAGGSRIPKITESQARSIAELRALGGGVNRALVVHFNTAESSKTLRLVLTMLDPHVSLAVVGVPVRDGGGVWLSQDIEQARHWKRELKLETLPAATDPNQGVVHLAQQENYDLLIVGLPTDTTDGKPPLDTDYLLHHSPCQICMVASPPPSSGEGHVEGET